MATFRRKRSRKYRNKNTRRKSRNARKSNIKRRGKKSLRGGGIFGLPKLFGSSKASDKDSDKDSHKDSDKDSDKNSQAWWNELMGETDGVPLPDEEEYALKTESEAKLEKAEENLKRKQEEAEGEIQLIMNRQNKTREEANNIYKTRQELLQANLKADNEEWAKNPSRYAWMDEPDVGIK